MKKARRFGLVLAMLSVLGILALTSNTAPRAVEAAEVTSLAWQGAQMPVPPVVAHGWEGLALAAQR